MDYYISLTAVQQVRWDKPNALIDESVPQYLKEKKALRQKYALAKKRLTGIVISNAHLAQWKKFGSKEELIRVMMIILEEVCVEEMEQAIQYYEEKGIIKAISYLLSCCE